MAKKTTAREWLTKNKPRYKDRRKWISDCAKALNVSRAAAENIAPRVWPLESKKLSAKQKPINGLSETDLRRRHDNAYKVAEAASKLTAGEFIPEADFVSSLRLKGGYRSVLERQQFERYRGKADGIVYWGHPESIKRLKDDRVLS